ncbi:uncharacterized protein LOC117336780 [Pecten maximus]|uniref:uncharacterized protein LOC117336780 n=1 Tax=Pecten maximus TaxID=6579 RepID=UPI001458289B|nr:uncharacterized protein LOC117336780 [Pecten maximus]
MTNKDSFCEFHTRSMKRAFKNKINNIAHVSPMILNFIYKELTMDATTAEHPDTQERLRLISLGETDLIADLRHCNPGRPSEKFDTFFQHLADLVEESTAADERRQGTSHLSEWISLSDMIEKARQRCPEMTLIPSKSLVRLQFAPRNPYAKSAWNFTSKIDVQYKIQRRQLRMNHPDQHYCNALFKYMKEMAIELQKEGVSVALFSCDDKAKVPIGEQGFSVSTGVRGKQTIAPTSTTLVAADHDMTKSSLTPSVILECDIPDTVEKSFVRGQVSVTVNDSVFQTSNPFRHAASLSKRLAGRSLQVLLKYTDGGVDHRNTLESVKCASICLFKEHNLDLLVAGRCAPGHSWRNPAERVMSILNLGLQNCALERVSLDVDSERMLGKCGSMKEIREMASKKPELRNLYTQSVEPVQALISNRFRRLKLKENPIVASDPVTDEAIDVLKRHLRELFPQMDLDKLQKVHTKKVPAYVAWKEVHCQERQYSFQIRKCDNPACCLQEIPNSTRPKWLQDPVLRDADHYMTYNEMKGLETADLMPTNTVDMKKSTVTPTTKCGSVPKKRQPKTSFISENELEGDFSFSAQTARSSVTCVECRKPRVVYSKLKFSGRQELQLAELMSEYIYTCGSPLTPPGHGLHGKALVRMTLTCANPIEVPFYSASLGRLDLCYYCGGCDGEVDQELKKQYKTVLPVCLECLEHEQPPCYRPYGKKSKSGNSQ